MQSCAQLLRLCVRLTSPLLCPALQTAEAVRLRCLEAQELICHLQTFSCHSAGSDFSKLPGIFTNDATLAEAAVSTPHHRMVEPYAWIGQSAVG